LRPGGCGSLRCANLHSRRLGLAATTQLEVPRELATKIGDIIRRETALLIESAVWPARLLAPRPWDPNFA